MQSIQIHATIIKVRSLRCVPPPSLRFIMPPIRSMLAGCLLSLLACATAFLPDANSQEAPSEAPIHFETEVRPILKAHCFHCHGEQEHREGGLDLRLVHLLEKGGDSGAAIVPGNADASLLIQRVQDGQMPPGGKTIPDAQKQILRRWIQAGALTKRPEPQTPTLEDWSEEERNFWLFQPVVSGSVPKVAHADAHADAHAMNSPIDAFVAAKLLEKQLPSAPLADRVTLIRRLSLDLLGLPPTQEEIQAFVEDSRPDAYERTVDRLLADPRYGEHWGRHWLDVAGYADSDGYRTLNARGLGNIETMSSRASMPTFPTINSSSNS